MTGDGKMTFNFIAMAAIECCYKMRRLVFQTEIDSEELLQDMIEEAGKEPTTEEYIERVEETSLDSFDPKFIQLMAEAQRSAVTVANLYDEYLEEQRHAEDG